VIDVVRSTPFRFVHVASGARIAWARSGSGPPLVRVAHWMTHVEHDPASPVWRPWLARLGQRLSIVRYDERGCGLSSGDDVPLGIDASVEELEVVIDACGESRVALLGMSAGASVALAYAARHPDRVSHLVLLGGYLRGLLRHKPGTETQAFHDAIVNLIRLGWGRSNPAVQQFFTTTMVPDATPEEAAALNAQQRLSCDGEHAARIVEARARIDVASVAGAVRVPTLVLHGSGDALVPVERGRELAAAIPGAQFATLDMRNHIPLAGSPSFDHFCRALTDFICAPPVVPGLTGRERELAMLVAEGLDNHQIAARLGLAEKTVRNALSGLYAKLGVEGRPQAVARTRDLGFGAPRG